MTLVETVQDSAQKMPIKPQGVAERAAMAIEIRYIAVSIAGYRADLLERSFSMSSRMR